MIDLPFWFMLWSWIIFFVLVHEYGHYLVAKKRRIYKKWGVFPFPHIKLKKPYPRRIDYLSGILASYMAFPFFILIFPLSLFNGILSFTLIALGGGFLDLVVVVFYGKIKKWRIQGVNSDE